MLARVIFFSAVAAAALVVIILALRSPPPRNDHQNTNRLLSFSIYVQPIHPLNSRRQQADLLANGAFIFRYNLAPGPKNSSHVIGKAQGFAVLIEQFALASFNTVYLTFNTPKYYGSLCIEARRARYSTEEELIVVGGTGSFAFAQGVARFTPKNQIRLRLVLQGESRTTHE